MSNSTAAEVILLPEGRIINNSLFVQDQYNEQAKPSYKIELAFPKGTLDKFFDKCLDHAVSVWGKGADDDDLIIPIKNGDDMAKKRIKDGKPGDAYAGMEVIRANTIYNKHGEQGPGGISVYAPDGASEIGAANQSEVYNGCYAIAAVTIGQYKDPSTGNNALTFYLSAVQKVRDGDALTSPKDHSSLFKAVGRSEPANSSDGAPQQRRRAG